jgi:hypothetical protein
MSRLPLKDVHAFRDRHGHLRHYFRKSGRRVPLPGRVGSEKFMTAYQAALGAGAVAPEIGADRTKPGTINSPETSTRMLQPQLLLVGEEARDLILRPRAFLYLNDEIGGHYPTDTDEGRGKTASADS